MTFRCTPRCQDQTQNTATEPSPIEKAKKPVSRRVPVLTTPDELSNEVMQDLSVSSGNVLLSLSIPNLIYRQLSFIKTRKKEKRCRGVKIRQYAVRSDKEYQDYAQKQFLKDSKRSRTWDWSKIQLLFKASLLTTMLHKFIHLKHFNSWA